MSDVLGKGILAEDLGEIVDEIVTIDMTIERIMRENQIDNMEERKKLLKAKVERNMGDEHTKVIEGKLGKAVRVTQNRKNVNTEVLYTKYGISQSEVDSVTVVKPVSFIKVSKK